MAEPTDSERDEALLKEIVTRGWATQAQVGEAARLHASAMERGQGGTLDDVLVSRGLVSADRVDAARRAVGSTMGRTLRVGKYEIIGRLGEGGAGIVYRAYQTTLGREVALKVLSKQREGQEEYLDRFLREARVAVTLNHVNIVRGLDFGHADGYHYFAMELVEGETFLRVIQREGRLPEDRAIDVALQMVRALGHAQTYRIVHRDIKPENILVTKSGTAKLCDLGLARPIIEGGAADSQGRPIGTALYVAPEQIRHVTDLDSRADIYSLGATLYHALTGSPPYQGRTSGEILRRHLDDPVPNPRDNVLEISSGAAAVVTKMLAKDRADRYQSLDALEEDLEAVLDGRPPVNTITLGRRPTSLSGDAAAEPATRRAPVRRGPGGGAVVVAVVSLGLLGGAAWWVLRPKPEVVVVPQPDPAQTTAPGTGDKPRSGGMGVDRDAVREDQENAAAAALGEAEKFGAENGGDSPSAVDRYRLIAKEHEGTSSGRVAAERAAALEKARVDRIAAQLAEREKRFAAAMAAGTLKAAHGAWDALPADWAGTDAATRAAAAREEVLGKAREQLVAARVVAAAVAAGDEARTEEARSTLGAIEADGLPGVAEEAATALASMEAAVESRIAARAAAEETWDRVAPAAVAALRNGVDAARRIAEAAAPALAPVKARSDDLLKALAEAGVFRAGAVAGFKRLATTGETVKLRVPARPGGVLAGRAAGATEEALEVQRGPAVESVALEDVHPEDLANLAWPAVNAADPAMHRGAALFLMARGAFSAAEDQIRQLDALEAKAAAAFVRPLLERVRGLSQAAADGILKEAEVLRLQKRLPEARAAYARAVAASEGYARSLWMQGAFLLESDRDPAPATAVLEAAAALGPEEPEAWYHVGEARRRGGRLEESLEAYEKYLAGAPADAPLRAAAATSLQEIRAAAVEKSAREAREAGGRAYRKEQWAESEAEWRRVLRFVPDDPEATYFLAKSLLGQNRHVDGYLLFRRFLAGQRSGGSRVDDAKRAVKDMEQRLGDSSPAAAQRHRDGANLASQGKFREAVDAFTAALDLAPLRGDTYVRRGQAHQQLFLAQGRKEDLHQAAADLEIAVQLNDRSGETWTTLALVRFTQEDWERAAAAAVVAIERDPASGLACEVMARACNSLKRFTEAEDAASQGIKREPRGMLFIARGEARLGLGRLQEAKDDLETADRKYDLSPAERQYRVRILGAVLDAEKKASGR